MNNSGLNMEIVKDHNRALIIQLICTNNGVTRQDLTEATNLTPMTLTNITSELNRCQKYRQRAYPKTTLSCA